VTELGASLAALAAGLGVAALRPRSVIGMRLARLRPDRELPHAIRGVVGSGELARSGLPWREVDLLAAKMTAAIAGAAVAAVAALLVPIGPGVVVVAAYVGLIAPSLYVTRVAARRREEADRALVTLLEWAEALVASGRPIETTFAAIAERGLGAGLLDGAVRAAARSYALGAPLFPALAREAAAVDLAALAELASDLERSRDLGRGAAIVLRDHRDRRRASERARSLEAASQVESRLMLVMVLCYMPALMLLVVIPLFVGLVTGLFV
jgi:tight adherence protein C